MVLQDDSELETMLEILMWFCMPLKLTHRSCHYKPVKLSFIFLTQMKIFF